LLAAEAVLRRGGESVLKRKDEREGGWKDGEGRRREGRERREEREEKLTASSSGSSSCSSSSLQSAKSVCGAVWMVTGANRGKKRTGKNDEGRKRDVGAPIEEGEGRDGGKSEDAP
jgi:hypothetical protein